MNIAGLTIDVGDMLKGAGQLAKDIRTALTGKEPIDAAKAAELAMRAHELELKAQEMENSLLLAQAHVNELEAQSGSNFRGGWRPAAGWTCVLGLLYTFLLQPFMTWGSGFGGYPGPPQIDTSMLVQLLFAMLGLAGMRAWEKRQGVAK